jgi:predicted RNA-binding protein with PUA-like domain
MCAYWLMKCEPETYSIDDLKRDGKIQWEGVRNYQARNYMKNDMRIGDKVLFYHSDADPSGVAGVAQVCREGYPDHFSWNPKSKYFDSKSTEASPRWWMVDICFVEKLPRIVSIGEMRDYSELAELMILKKGCRLSITPVTRPQFDFILKLAKAR